MSLDDYRISSLVHLVPFSFALSLQEAQKRNIHFFDCPMFPEPSSLLSYETSPPSFFLGGKGLPESYAFNVLCSLGLTIYHSGPNYGIIHRALVAVPPLLPSILALLSAADAGDERNEFGRAVARSY